MRVERLDHLVLTVTDLAATLSFYTRVCGMSHIVFGDEERHALAFGNQKINLHIWGTEHEPKAALTTPGSADLCFVVDASPQEVVARLTELQVPIEAGPAARVGATGPITSVYVRDPDGNLVELASYPGPQGVSGGPGQQG
jgi:catechol 2,3-dioxygenase-like lactoylglutathione lyase family enzyme